MTKVYSIFGEGSIEEQADQLREYVDPDVAAFFLSMTQQQRAELEKRSKLLEKRVMAQKKMVHAYLSTHLASG